MEHSLDVLKNKMPIRRSKNGMLNLMNVSFNPFKMECPKKNYMKVLINSFESNVILDALPSSYLNPRWV